jgi:hypothetical protein
MDSTIDHAAGTTPGRVGLLGAGGQAREAASYLLPGTKLFWAVSPDYLDASAHDQVDITAPSPTDRNTWVLGAVGAPALRRDLVAAWPGDRFVTVVSPAAYVDPRARSAQAPSSRLEQSSPSMWWWANTAR